ncbi:uncharacterized protein J7T54_002299 [Emericellopsis cladophorae]|uniref:Pyridoxamine 5'-phosphate oxidase Alr4036 family FMN-binding domain-containing protein n=1 Tax=Emericellopsis cladophorae TaxID=2686198 RepID=A0A9P9Y0U6_9HYPO|nr:uncharacterized protein J7T54_002299 [Emericellopsis cladophorae]KAI6781406.1 hypothetical protein J7T54_002299 [Emericellopsis cladophorae]
MAETARSPAPWRANFLAHVKDMDEPSFNLSTLHRIDDKTIVPRSRTVIYRGMWADMPVNSKNQAELNPKGFESDMPTLTSDARMEKVPEMLLSGQDADDKEMMQSGKGGPVEAVFWCSKAKTQWRLRGHTYIIGPDIGSDAVAPVRAAVERHMRGSASEFSFTRELTAHFGNLSPMMRGTFRNPPPGTPLSETLSAGEALGQMVEDLDDAVARKNFRVVIIVPEEVDQVDLSDPARVRRWNYLHVGEGTAGSWKITETWP